MSLDVSLYKKIKCPHCGETVETGEEIYSSNITHNLGGMAEAAGIYMHLWYPEELGIKSAAELIEPLTKGLELMESNPAHFETFNASNGWGKYKHFMPFVQNYLNACRENPDAAVNADR